MCALVTWCVCEGSRVTSVPSVSAACFYASEKSTPKGKQHFAGCDFEFPSHGAELTDTVAVAETGRTTQ